MYIHPIKIGNVEISNNIFLAPMAGISDMPFRILCKEKGAGLVYTEMVSSKGMFYDDNKTKKLMEIDKKERPVAVQIFGSDPEIMGRIAKEVSKEADIIDINMGCPAPKIVRNGEGSALMKNPSLAGKLIEAAVKASCVPVTVKIRRGFKEENCAEIAKVAEECGAVAVCVHGRFTNQMYSGESSLEAIKRVCDAVSIPVIGNGDILNGEDAAKMMKETGCSGVMIARGAFGNPFIFREIKEYFKSGSILPPADIREKIDMAIRHTELLVKFHGEKIGILNARKHAAWYLKGIRGGAEAKRKVYTATTLEEMKNILLGVK